MGGVLDNVDQRTNLVGENRLELLLFRLAGKQVYGINVFKVKEVLPCPTLNALPGRNRVVRGVAHIRGGTLSILDTSLAIGKASLGAIDHAFVIITEYNRTAQGFLVQGVDRIVNMNWSDIHPPPRGAGQAHYLTAVTEVDGELVEIIDVEKILAETAPINERIGEDVLGSGASEGGVKKHVLIVDDSVIARKQIQRVMQSLGVETTIRQDGREALDYLLDMVARGEKPAESLAMIISDIEMPEMDGYTFTAEVRNHPELKDLYILLHTSLSGVFNKAMVQKVGADNFLAKFSPNELAFQVNERIKAISGEDLIEETAE
ncbi:chemotaxis protein CheV [Marinimicrobium sp. ARAG 43.8]|uniref:chemotaxis protein CheV n=1 Tax=Marinimicrobium sp. ARAG 43.8 TaxID=3418719 RepID=UPI003CED5D78